MSTPLLVTHVVMLIACFTALVQNIQINLCLILLATMATITFWRKSFSNCSPLTRFDIYAVEIFCCVDILP